MNPTLGAKYKFFFTTCIKTIKNYTNQSVLNRKNAGSKQFTLKNRINCPKIIVNVWQFCERKDAHITANLEIIVYETIAEAKVRISFTLKKDFLFYFHWNRKKNDISYRCFRVGNPSDIYNSANFLSRYTI